MVRLYKSVIRSNVSGGNIPVKVYANSSTQARDLIKQYPYFQSFVSSPMPINEDADDDYDDLFGIEI